MRLTTVWVVGVLFAVLSDVAWGETIYSSDFSAVSSLTDAGWVANGSVPVNDGIVQFGNRKARYVFNESYGLSESAGADNTVDEIWIHVRGYFPGDSDVATIRMGLGTTTFDYTDDGGRYAGFHIRADSDLSDFVEVMAISQNTQGENVSPLPANDGFVDLYCKIFDNNNGDLVTELWINPADPNNLGAAQSTATHAYSYSQVIDTFDINAWASDMNHQIDSVDVWTVRSETGSLSLFSIPEERVVCCENFNSYENVTLLNNLEGWIARTGTPVIQNGILEYGNSKSEFDFAESYALDDSTVADHNVDELWIRIHGRFPGDSDEATFRLGLGNSSVIDVDAFGRYGSVHVRADSDLSNLVQFFAVSQNQSGTIAAPANDGFVDIYCKLSNDASGNLLVQVWNDPADPQHPGVAASSSVQEYNGTYGGRVINRVEINAWGGTSGYEHEIDELVVGTSLNTVMP